MPGFLRAAIAAGFGVLLCFTKAAAQEHRHPPAPGDSSQAMLPGPLGIAATRMGSGTSWLPEASPMHAYHWRAGRWGLMLHGVVFAAYDKQNGLRGDKQFAGMNWVMGMASRNAGGGLLTFRTMLSAEPLTVGGRGYPLLLQSGESYQGEPLHDRQHPHDLWMELAAQYERPIGRNLAVSFYAAPVGEPALGPVAFPHRPSAWNNPFAPLAHHWQDATHITFGVLTAGLFTRTVKVEASVFNGREPDEERYGFDYEGRSLDSWSARIFVNPGPTWSLSASYGYLKSPEGLEPDESQKRLSASVIHASPIGMRGSWSWALVYGGNKHSDRPDLENSLVAEANLELGSNGFFARAGYVRKSGHDLSVQGPGDAEFDLGQLTVGYLRELGNAAGLSAGIGGLVNLARIPASLEPEYGTRWPRGFALYLRLRPKGM